MPAGAFKNGIRENVSQPYSGGGSGMKKLLNTLYVTSENSYLGLDGENVVVYEEKEEIGRCRFITWRESYRLDIGE